MSRARGLLVLAGVASMTLAMAAGPVRAQEQPPAAPAAPAAPAVATPDTAAPAPARDDDASAAPPPALPMATTPPQEAPIVTGPPAPTPAPQATEHYWYVLMLADLSWLWASIRLDEASIGALAYPTVAPAMHLVLRNDRGALGSLSMRLGALGLAYLSYLLVDNPDAPDSDGIVIAGGVFLSAVAVFDWFYFGRKPVPAPGPVEGGQAATSTQTWAPGVLASEHGLQLGLTGRF
jgi:hypothetical protein